MPSDGRHQYNTDNSENKRKLITDAFRFAAFFATFAILAAVSLQSAGIVVAAFANALTRNMTVASAFAALAATRFLS